jgi:hypothetical protein
MMTGKYRKMNKTKPIKPVVVIPALVEGKHLQPSRRLVFNKPFGKSILQPQERWED